MNIILVFEYDKYTQSYSIHWDDRYLGIFQMIKLLIDSAYTCYMAFYHLIFLWTKYLGAQTCLIHLYYPYSSHKTGNVFQKDHSFTRHIHMVSYWFYELFNNLPWYYQSFWFIHMKCTDFNFLFSDYNLLKCLLVIYILNIHLSSLAIVIGSFVVLFPIDKIP